MMTKSSKIRCCVQIVVFRLAFVVTRSEQELGTSFFEVELVTTNSMKYLLIYA